LYFGGAELIAADVLSKTANPGAPKKQRLSIGVLRGLKFLSALARLHPQNLIKPAPYPQEFEKCYPLLSLTPS